ncbi:hypothetical protein [Pseudonocardia acaciae]|uniref:hypothetical protein n=1 Tax=Pseudonocardia acaciae TaxID=551276 RepID=UPI0014701376|nr:hypothetical protein [Pseudonocardia acaciae]
MDTTREWSEPPRSARPHPGVGPLVGSACTVRVVDRGEFDNGWADHILETLHCEVSP